MQSAVFHLSVIAPGYYVPMKELLPARLELAVIRPSYKHHAAVGAAYSTAWPVSPRTDSIKWKESGGTQACADGNATANNRHASHEFRITRSPGKIAVQATTTRSNHPGATGLARNSTNSPHVRGHGRDPHRNASPGLGAAIRALPRSCLACGFAFSRQPLTPTDSPALDRAGSTGGPAPSGCRLGVVSRSIALSRGRKR